MNEHLGLTDAELNLCQQAGVVSDNCITWEDVAREDLERAIEFLNNQQGEGLA